MTRLFLFLCPIFLFLNSGFAKGPAHYSNQPVSIVIDHLSHVTCAGASNGIIGVTALQGQGPFVFQWSNGASGPEVTQLPAGLYSVTVTDANNEQAVLSSIEIDEPSALSLTPGAIQHIDCLHPAGSISVSANGGTPAYQFLWSGGQTGPIASGLTAGAYTVTVSDAHGCSSTLSAAVQSDVVPPLANAGAPVNLLCSNTTHQLTGSGSAGPTFSYAWTAQNGGNIASGATTLTPTINHSGTYLLTVANSANGCTAQSSTTVTGTFQAPAATAGGGVLNCQVISLALQATAEPLNTHYGWTGPNGYTSSLLHPVISVPGNYVFTVTDTITGCFTPVTAVVTSNFIHPTVSATASGTITCTTTAIQITATSGQTGVGFSWTGPNNFSSNLPQANVSVSGTYFVTVTDPQNGCTGSSSVAVASNTTPPAVSASVANVLTCVVNSVQITGVVQPLLGTNYSWAGPNGFTSSQLSPIVNAPGAYVLSATILQNGCTATTSVVVVRDNTPPALSATGGTITCSNPSVTLHANSGTAGATFQWTGPNGYTSTLQHPVITVAGFYSVTATNPANGCVNAASVNVASNLAMPVLLANGSSITCTNPVGKPTAMSTTSGATFAWSGPGGFTATGPNPSVTLPGFYTVVATNPLNGCTTGTSVQVTDNTTPPIAYAGEPRTLNCLNTPIQITGFGSSSGSNFTYLWTTLDGHIVSGTLGLFPRVDAIGTYTLKVTNTQNGCTATSDVEVTQATPVSVTINPVVQVSCNGSATGSATAKPAGGNGVYTYGWSNGSTTATVTGLPAGTYSVTVSDSDGCSGSNQVIINQPAPLQAIMSVVNQTVFGLNNGSAAVTTTTGGTNPYTYKWSNGPTTAAINNLAPGVYTVTITDNKGCTLAKTVNINALNCALSGTLAATNITCSGAGNGTITANLTGGVTPINYVWSNGGSSKTISNLQTGTYKVTATDANGCSVILSTPITSPDPLTLAFAAKENVPCPTSKTGLLTAGGTGGTTPYTFTWSTGASGATLSGLGTGTYTVTLTDAHGCTKSLSNPITISDQTPPHLVLKNATVALDASGAVAITPGLFDNGSYDQECSIANWTVTPTTFGCTQLGAQTVTLKATDVNGNSSTGTATVTITDNIAPTLTCPGSQTVGICTPVVTFNAPQVIDNCTLNPALLQLKNGLPSGSAFPAGKTHQIFSYTDPAGNTGECSFDITVMEMPTIQISATQTSCSGQCDGTAKVALIGLDVPIVLLWSDGQTGIQATGLCAGTYTVTISDPLGCTTVQSVVVPAANQVPFSVQANVVAANCVNACDGTASLSLTGGSAPFNIAWNNGQHGPDANNLCPGAYLATVTDANGCSQEQAILVGVEDKEAPTLACPANINTAFCTATVGYAQPQVQDNCPIDPQQIHLLSGLPSGSTFPVGQTTQVFRYTDSAGNTGECSFTVSVTGAPVLSHVATPVSCAGWCNGQAVLTATGGLSPLTIKWSNGQTGAEATLLCAGTYTATVTDANGCKVTTTAIIQQPALLELAVVQMNNDIGGAGVGSIQLAVTGGTSPYTFAWTRNGQPFSTDPNPANLTAGMYAVVVTDANGCTVARNALTISNTVDAQEAAWAEGMGLSPNPATTSVQLSLANPLGQEAEVFLLGLGGNIIRTMRLGASDLAVLLDVSDLPAGLWLVQVRAQDGRQAVKKLVVRR